MKNKSFLVLPFFLTVLLLGWGFAGMTAVSRTVYAAGRYVAVTGTDSGDCTNQASPCRTVNYAVLQAVSGDTIYIAAGVYTETAVYLNPSAGLGKDLTFSGAGMNDTILDGAGTNKSVFQLVDVTTSIANLTIRNGNNQANFQGSGILQSGGVLSLDRVRLTGNTSGGEGGGLYATGILTMTNAIVDHNQAGGNGGGITLWSSASSPVLLENVTIYSNTVTSTDNGGGLASVGNNTVTLRNVTISGNTARWAGGVYLAGSGSGAFVNVTIAGNTSTAPGPAVQNYATATWVNSIVANNNAADCANGGTWTSNGYNLSSDSSCNFTQTGDAQNSDPQLMPLGSYGGDVPTMALQKGSPAIDSGGAGSCPAADARGVTRPQDGDNNGGAVCDKGAYEAGWVNSTAVTISGPSSALVNTSQSFQAALQPVTNTFPVTYTWQADEQTTVTRTGKGITDTVSFVWASTGNKTITVTAHNGINSVSDTFSVNVNTGVQGISNVTVSGPTAGSSYQTYAFTATVSPSNATQPITYTWQVDGQSPVTHAGQGLSDTASFTWSSDGSKTITVTASNAAGSKTATHVITLADWYVNGATGNDANGCQAANDACKTIGGAISKAAAGDTIRIAAGTYNENLYISQSQTFIGAGAGQTIIDGGGSQTTLFINNSGAALRILLSGVTVQNGGDSGIYNTETLLLNDSVVRNNSNNDPFGGLGGGIFNSGVLTATNSSFTGNSATNGGSALFNDGQVWLERVTVSGNTISGGNNSTIHNQNGGALNLTNVTLSDNTGQGVINTAGSTVTALNVTIAGNTLEGVNNGGTFNLKNSILAGNNGGGTNCATGGGTAPLTSQGYNLEDGNSCGLNGTADQTNTDAKLGPLADNGGATQTRALFAGSPAIDAGTNNGCPATDQRGVSRPQNGTCDVGAYEYDPANPPQMYLYLPLVLRP